MDSRVECKIRNHRAARRKHVVKLLDMGFGGEIFNITPKAKATNAK